MFSLQSLLNHLAASSIGKWRSTTATTNPQRFAQPLVTAPHEVVSAVLDQKCLQMGRSLIAISETMVRCNSLQQRGSLSVDRPEVTAVGSSDRRLNVLGTRNAFEAAALERNLRESDAIVSSTRGRRRSRRETDEIGPTRMRETHGRHFV